MYRVVGGEKWIMGGGAGGAVDNRLTHWLLYYDRSTRRMA